MLEASLVTWRRLSGQPGMEAILTLIVPAPSSRQQRGAMVLCQHYFDQARSRSARLNLLPGCCVLPHTIRSKELGAATQPASAESALAGIDEETGLLNDGPAGE